MPLTARILYPQWEANLALKQDARLIERELVSLGYECTLEDGSEHRTLERHTSLNVFLEKFDPIVQQYTGSAGKNILVLNLDRCPEWYQWMSRGADVLIAKTREAYEKIKTWQRTYYVPWCSIDARATNIEKERIFLHPGGTNKLNNTVLVAKTWKNMQDLPLYLCYDREFIEIDEKELSEHVIPLDFIMPELELRRLQNRCFFHVLPSLYENSGHAFWQCLSCGAIPISTMTFDTEWPVLSSQDYPKPLYVEKSAFSVAFMTFCQNLMLLSDQELYQQSACARAEWEKREKEFKIAFKTAIKAVQELPARPRVFDPPPAPRPLLPRYRRIRVPVKKHPYLYNKQAPPEWIEENVPDYEFSLVTRFMNRREFLEKTLPTWMKVQYVREIIIVDWSSTENILDLVEKYQDGRLFHAYVPEQKYFHRTKPLNLGCRLTRYEYILHTDCDVQLDPQFLHNVMEPGAMYINGHLSLYGTCIFPRKIFQAVNGYNEFFEDYGDEDIEFYERLKKHCPVKSIDSGRAYHIPHGDAHRLQYAHNKSLMGANGQYFGRWNENNHQEKFTVILTGPSGLIVKEKV